MNFLKGIGVGETSMNSEARYHGLIGRYKEGDRTFTVVRFPSGVWSWGGRRDDIEYAECDVWRVLLAM